MTASEANCNSMTIPNKWEDTRFACWLGHYNQKLPCKYNPSFGWCEYHQPWYDDPWVPAVYVDPWA
jgi:hypothetical protein